jgi:hypothetical protein
MNSLRILGKNFQVKWEDNVADDAIGMCETHRQIIRVEKGLPKETEEDTLLHEVIHAVDETLGLGLSERQVIALASGLLAVYNDNQSIIHEYFNGTRTPRIET